jgi:hypothetical protein
MGIRAENLARTTGREPFSRTLHGKVAAVEDQATVAIVDVDLGIRDVVVRVRMASPVKVQPGDPIELAVSIEHLRFFDPGSGTALTTPVER